MKLFDNIMENTFRILFDEISNNLPINKIIYK